ncbi:hypothetical protein DICA1_B03004 [Diutina catenulata]
MFRLLRQPLRRFPTRRQVNPVRSLNIGPTGMAAIKGWGPIINVLGGAYIGGLIVGLGSLYLLYHDANERQNIPFELKFSDQITTVKAINKDDVLHSPRYAVKHYRRLLIDLAAQNGIAYEEGPDRYEVPLLSADTLVYKKSPEFANFYIDIVLRYARALLAKGELHASINTLAQVITNDTIFYKLGDAERVSQCARLLAKLEPSPVDKQAVLARDLDMLTRTYAHIHLRGDLLQPDSRVSDEVLSCLDELAAAKAKGGNLDGALNIYLANLQRLTDLEHQFDEGTLRQAQHPLFDCSKKNLVLRTNEIKAHISEVMWAKGFRKNAVAWSEDVVNSLFLYHTNEAAVGPVLVNVLNNLDTMYAKLKDERSRARCRKVREQLDIFEQSESEWYESFINRWSRIIWSKGPLGIIEKPLTERFGKPQPLPEIEEIEGEDEE